ncbi:gametogenetin-binding protein 2-like isoform X3 [Artemia franciscana]|uniref:Gametogenetin-binding protein 2-like n=2 Tax=Artemia franciscana TaxID=6661 RepID=A0AA88L044_ARTSF|nr:hypothetical protein QYM36_008601 [Artemia franciscana]
MMAQLISLYREDEKGKLMKLEKRQMPLQIDENLAMVLQLPDLGLNHKPPVKAVDAFSRRCSVLTSSEISKALTVSVDDVYTILGQFVSCVGCRKTAERLYVQLYENCHDALHPLVFPKYGFVQLAPEIQNSWSKMYILLCNHGSRLGEIGDSLKKSRQTLRCPLHSLDAHRARLPGSWKTLWDCLAVECREELSLIEGETLLQTMEAYLHRHRFCPECRLKVNRAYSLLMGEVDPSEEKGYKPVLYAGLKCCPNEKHVHVQIDSDLISLLIGRAEPELLGRLLCSRERHAKTIEVAQEEVLTCVGICLLDRFQKAARRLREEHQAGDMLLCATLAAMRMSLDVTLEQKRGVSELELLCEELTKEEEVAQQRREQKRLKRRKRKGKKGETASGNNEEVEENPGDNDTEEEALVPPPSSIECKVRKPSPLKSKNSLKQESKISSQKATEVRPEAKTEVKVEPVSPATIVAENLSKEEEEGWTCKESRVKRNKKEKKEQNLKIPHKVPIGHPLYRPPSSPIEPSWTACPTTDKKDYDHSHSHSKRYEHTSWHLKPCIAPRFSRLQQACGKQDSCKQGRQQQGSGYYHQPYYAKGGSYGGNSCISGTCGSENAGKIGRWMNSPGKCESDSGYVSSGTPHDSSSSPSSPEGSDVACTEGYCNHDDSHHDTSQRPQVSEHHKVQVIPLISPTVPASVPNSPVKPKIDASIVPRKEPVCEFKDLDRAKDTSQVCPDCVGITGPGEPCLHRRVVLSLEQMLEESCSSDGEESAEPLIPLEEVRAFQDRKNTLAAERELLRISLRRKFDNLCNIKSSS